MSMTCPPGWHDKSMLILSAPAPGGSGITPNLVVTRDRMPDDLPAAPAARMTAIVDLQVAMMREKLAGFSEVARRLIGSADSPSAEVKVDWSSAQALLTQSLTFVDGGNGVLLIATGTAARGEFAQAEPLFQDMLKSFKIV
jgi:hypothetical protein